ncbi:MAG: Gldg family protein [Clostridia bacterium]|nr:Gldg family protein [Clostridia bacterium]
MKMKTGTSRKLRYGGVTVAMTALIIAVIVIVNVIFTALAQKFLWYADLTPELLFTLSDNCIDLIANGDDTYEQSFSPVEMVDKAREERRAQNPDFKDEDLMIRIIFCDDPDAWEETSSRRYIYETAKQLAAEFPDYIEIENHNIIWNPSSVSQYGIYVSTSSVIIEFGTEYRVRNLNTFYTYSDTTSEEPWAYNGEKILAASILAVTRAESPVACLTTNHGETLDDTELLTTLDTAGFQVQELNMSTDEIPENCRLIVVFNPQTDFLVKDGYSSDVDEIEKLDQFLDDDNSLMVFMSPDLTTPLQNFESYLEEWGISYNRYKTEEAGKTTYHPYIVRDTTQSLTVDGYTIKGEYYTKGGQGSQLTYDMTNNVTNPPMMVFRDAMSISYSDLYSPQHYVDADDASISYDYATYGVDGTYRSIYDVFTTGENAVAMANGQQVAKATAVNPLKLMTVSVETHSVVENATLGSTMTETAYVIACGSTDFASRSLLQSNSYGNSTFLEYALRTVGKEPVPVGVKFKPFGDYTIDTITTSEATQYTVVLTVVPAVLALGAGVFVIVRRKNR